MAEDQTRHVQTLPGITEEVTLPAHPARRTTPHQKRYTRDRHAAYQERVWLEQSSHIVSLRKEETHIVESRERQPACLFGVACFYGP